MKKILLLNMFLLSLIGNPSSSEKVGICIPDTWQHIPASRQIRLQFSDDGSRVSMVHTAEIPDIVDTVNNLSLQRPNAKKASYFTQQRTLPEPQILKVAQPERPNVMQPESLNVPQPEMPPLMMQQRLQVRIRFPSKNLTNVLMNTLTLLSEGVRNACHSKQGLLR